MEKGEWILLGFISGFILFGCWAINQIFHISNIWWLLIYVIASIFIVEISWLELASAIMDKYRIYQDSVILIIFTLLGAITTYFSLLWIIGRLLKLF